MDNFFCYEIEYKGVFVEYTNNPLFSEREIHSYHEILFCQGMEVTLRTENRHSELRGNTLIVIPKGNYHCFDLGQQKHFPRLKVSIPDELISGLPVDIFSSQLSIFYPKKKYWSVLIERLCDAVKNKEENGRGFYVYSAVMMLLAELDKENSFVQEAYQSNNQTIVSAVRYVDENISGDLCVEKIAREINVSTSFLTHKFKAEMGISLHRFVVGKRMIYAVDLIEKGENPTKIYRDCGFSDYSSFYKAYCRFFGTTPSNQRKRALPTLI